MVEEGLARRGAAEKAGLADHSLYCAMKNPRSVAYYNRSLEALRTAELARGIHVAAEIRDDQVLGVSPAGATARIKAAAFIETGGREGASVTVNVQQNVQQPGYVLGVDPRFADVIDEMRESNARGTGRPTILENKDAENG